MLRKAKIFSNTKMANKSSSGEKEEYIKGHNIFNMNAVINILRLGEILSLWTVKKTSNKNKNKK